jgi:NADPH:quinone reductase-like Zn-dependent oxidoreductase
MRAVVYTEQGPPEVLHVAEVEEPHAGAGEVRVAVRAAGVNPVDWKVRSGMMPAELPKIDGREAAGVVDEVGEGAEGVSAGDEVFGLADGAAAEYAVMSIFARKPATASWEEVAGLPVAVETSVRVFKLLGGLSAGQTIVIDSASGGVGAAAVQLAVARGARVIGTASERNHEFLRSLGAEPTTYGPGLADRVRALAPDGVDYGFDTAGQGGVRELIELTGDPAKVATIADFGAGSLGVKVTGGAVAERAVEALPEAAELIEAGRFHLPVQQTFRFDDAAEAHRISEGGHVRGKLVLTP